MVVKSIAGVALIALLAVSCAEPGPARITQWTPDGANKPRGAALLRRAMIDGHDAARAEVGLAPLAWDDRLAADALAYAQTLARTRTFRHAEQAAGPTRQGENLFTGTRGAYDYREMVDLWVDEKRDFVNRPLPDISRTGRWSDVGHYSQIVWRTTLRFGCALASNDTDDYLVCRYSPAGNVWGQAAY